MTIHSGRPVTAAEGLGGDGVGGVDAGVSLVQGASRGLGLEFVSILFLSITSLAFSLTFLHWLRFVCGSLNYGTLAAGRVILCRSLFKLVA